MSHFRDEVARAGISIQVFGLQNLIETRGLAQAKSDKKVGFSSHNRQIVVNFP
jgi:hypothetical protein